MSGLSQLITNLHKAQKENNKKNIIDALFKLSQYHYNKNDSQKAKLFLNQILEIDKNHPNANYYISLIEIELGNHEKAIEHINKEIIINPKNQIAKSLLEKISINLNFPLITLFLVFINSILFALTYPQITLTDSIKYGLTIYNFNIFNAFTSVFMHINLPHFLINMFILLMFGFILEKSIGSFKFLLVFVISGIIGNIVQVFFSSHGIVLGASAALFGIIGALVIREPLLHVRVLGIFKVPLILVAGSFFTISALINIFYIQDFFYADIAHFIGFLSGIFVISLFFSERVWIFYNWIFIALGFWMIQYGFENIFFSLTLIWVFLILLGIILVSYSYISLKEVLRFKNETDL